MDENLSQPTDLNWPLTPVTQASLRRWLASALAEGVLSSVITGLVSSYTVVALTDSSSVATDASLGNIFTLTTTQDFTLANPTNPTNGQIIIYKIKQDGTGSRLITFGTNFRGSTDVPLPTLTTTANYVDYIMFIYDSAVTKWNCLATNLGFAT